MDSYDEDLSQNPFFLSFASLCPQLFAQCVVEGWLICIPRRDSLPKYSFTAEDFQHHVLKPLSLSPGERSGGKQRQRQRQWSGGSGVTVTTVSSSSSSLPPFSYDDTADDPGDENDPSESGDGGSVEGLPRNKLRGNWNYVTLSGVCVELVGSRVILDVEVPVENNNEEEGVVQLRKEVLFDETFYTGDRRKYKLLCVASPLNSTVDHTNLLGNDAKALGPWNLTSLRDCIDFIWIKGSLKVLETFDSQINHFLNNHPALESFPLPIQRNLVESLYLKCLEYAESTGLVPQSEDNASLSNFIHLRLKLATEAYVQHGVYRLLISAITSLTSNEDALVNKITRNLAEELTPEDVEIPPCFWASLPMARHELAKISSYSTALGKLSCLKRTIRHLKTESNSPLSTDDLLPIWTFLILKSPIGNWVGQLEFLRNFRFTSLKSQEQDENSFCIATLEAAIAHIKSGRVFSVSNSNFSEGGEAFLDFSDVWVFYSLHHLRVNERDCHPRLPELIDLVRRGDCEGLVEGMQVYSEEREEFNRKLGSPKEIERLAELCHPLCSCDECLRKCEEETEERAKGPLPSATDLANTDGLTLLHIAAIYGRPKVADLLIGMGSNLQAQDNLGMTPLHYAAARGHQNVLLLLLHGGSDLNVMTLRGESALFLACSNGHEGCVKALIYFAEQVGKALNISGGNNKKDSPLHVASRWGFLGIVQLLVESGAAINVRNLRHATPIDVVHNIHIKRVLQSSLRRRSLVQTNYGDFVNIEMVQKEDTNTGKTVMLISDPEQGQGQCQEVEKAPSSNSRRSSVSSERTTYTNHTHYFPEGPEGPRSRKISSVVVPNPSLLDIPRGDYESQSLPRSRKVSSIHVPNHNFLESCPELTVSGGNEGDENDDLVDPCPGFILNYYEEFDPSEIDHLRRVEVQDLNNSCQVLSEQAGKKDRDIQKLFNAIRISDIPLFLFYMGIPGGEELALEEEEDSSPVTPLPPCLMGPLCICHRCKAREAGLGLSLEVRNPEGLTPLIYSALHHSPTLVKILLKYGAEINAESENEKKTALDFAIDLGFDDIEDILLRSGAKGSASFCPEMCAGFEL